MDMRDTTKSKGVRSMEHGSDMVLISRDRLQQVQMRLTPEMGEELPKLKKSQWVRKTLDEALAHTDWSKAEVHLAVSIIRAEDKPHLQNLYFTFDQLEQMDRIAEANDFTRSDVVRYAIHRALKLKKEAQASGKKL